VRPDEGLVVYASIGDSHVFLVPEDPGIGARDLGWASTGRSRAFFLGDEFGRGTPEDDEVLVGCELAADVAAVVLATDGLSEHEIGVADPEETVLHCTRRACAADAPLRPLEACRSLAQAALDAHHANSSGDNIATAVLWLSRAER
jgi:hypothetical protein